jgi:hypothetical protein
MDPAPSNIPMEKIQKKGRKGDIEAQVSFVLCSHKRQKDRRKLVICPC